MTRKKEICKISTPFPVDFVCSEILFQLILEYLMRPSVLISGLLWTNNRMESQFRIHIFMYRCGTIKITSMLQIDCHTPVSVNAIITQEDHRRLTKRISTVAYVNQPKHLYNKGECFRKWCQYIVPWQQLFLSLRTSVAHWNYLDINIGYWISYRKQTLPYGSFIDAQFSFHGYHISLVLIYAYDCGT